MQPDILVLFGSSRSYGQTRTAVEKVFPAGNFELVDLTQRQLSAYDYNHANRDDDFQTIVQRMIQAEILVFATPVYWYSMSAMMKVFFDRFTDLLELHQDLLKQLRRKPCYVIVSGADKQLPDGFDLPFAKTCEYLGMEYRKTFYYCTFYRDMEPEGRRRDASAKLFGDRLQSDARAL